jgi:hypothetical protein
MSRYRTSPFVGIIALSLALTFGVISGCEDGKTALVIDEDTALQDVTNPDVLNVAPTLSVDLPDEEAIFSVGDVVPFQLTFSDVEDGAKGTVRYDKIPGDVSASAETDENGVITGEISGLETGKQTLTFIAVDSGGVETEASVVVLINTAPGAPVVTIDPAEPDTTDDLTVTVVEASVDVDRDSDQLEYAYAWSKDGELTDITGDTVPATKTLRDDVWRVEVRANDGSDEGAIAEATVTVGNAPPTDVKVAIEPFEATIISKLTCTATASDADGGTPSLSYEWRVNGNLIEGANEATLDLTAELTIVDKDTGDISNTIKVGDEVHCEVIASDDMVSTLPVSGQVVNLADYDTCADELYNLCPADATCGNNGTIHVDCTCNEGFEGDGTECLNVDDCDPNPCLNDGACQDEVSSYSCTCADGFEGDLCDINLDDCNPNPCQHGGLCADGVSTYTCDCELGFEGTNCEININECDPNPCQNGGGCTDDIASYTCECVVGYAGSDCETNVDECDPNPCQNGGTCTDGIAAYTCGCEPGYAGNNCEVNVNDCVGAPCQNGGTCTDQVNGFTCECPEGFAGKNCQTNVDDCDPMPCENDGTCTDGVNSYICSCPIGYTGENCGLNVNDCAADPCQNGGACTDDVNGYSCSCPVGFEGVHCELNIDDCAKKPCLNGGTCADGVDSYTCQCALGYDGLNCDNNIDDCAKKPCQNGGNCTDGVDSYTCQCEPGWTGKNCQENIDDCAKKPCLNGGTCTDQVNGYTCQCLEGFEGDLCDENIDDCAKKPCAFGTCVDAVNGYSCNCQPGYEGELCDINTDDCAKNPCLNGGECVDKVNGYACECPLGFEGGDCEVNIDDCKPNPCENGGTCVDGVAGFNCKCLDGFGGDVCEVNADDCAKKPCQNGGTCNDGVNSYTCTCPPGYGGINCEIDADGCDPNPCVNGKCVDGVDGYTCNCEPGWGGSNCEVNIDECAVEPCVNGVCIDGNNTFECICEDGWTGKDCSEDVNECDEGVKCFENAYCTNEIGGYNCVCNAGYAKVGGACYLAPKNPGDLLITEIQPNPTAVSDANGEWFEVYNTTSEILVLNGVTISDEGGDSYQVSDGANPVKIAPHSFFVFGKQADPKTNGGVQVDFQYKSFSLTNSEDEIILHSNKGKFLDAVVYNKDTFPTKSGHTFSYDPAAGISHEANDNGAYWCLGQEMYNEKDYGSPGAFNGACDPNAICEFMVEKGTWDCQCIKGYEGPATKCVDGDDCTPNPCLNGGGCSDQGLDAFACTCMDGWEGELCDINVDDCAKKPCLNGGVCTDLVAGYQCSCPAGWIGDNCEINEDDCAKKPCLNGGTCVDLVGGFQCKCVDGWEGKLCDINSNPCPEQEKPDCLAAGPCQAATATCGDKGWECLGESLIDGTQCESQQCGDAGICQKGVCECNDPCKGIDCQNGGVCKDGFCNCPNGFSGEFCQIQDDPCKGIDCQNGGVCKDGFCNCPEGWQGKLCDEDVDECDNPEKSLCDPNALCENLLGDYTCICMDGYEGDGFNECTPINPCQGIDCQNGGVCKEGTCNCPDGFSGEFCEIKDGNGEEVTYQKVFQEVFSKSCNGCHGGNGGLTISYDALVNAPAKQTANSSQMMRITPNNLSLSYLWHKVEGTHLSKGVDGQGAKMPKGGKLTDSQLDTLKKWIEGGALK